MDLSIAQGPRSSGSRFMDPTTGEREEVYYTDGQFWPVGDAQAPEHPAPVWIDVKTGCESKCSVGVRRGECVPATGPFRRG